MNTNNTLDAIYNDLLPELLAIPEPRVVHVNTELDPLVDTLTGAVEQVRDLVDASGSLAGLDKPLVDRLDRCCVALQAARIKYLTRPQPRRDDLPRLQKKAVELRKLWLSDIATMQRRGLIGSTALEGVVLPSAYDQIARELQLIASLMRQHWHSIQGQCALTLEELDAGDELALQILGACSLREQRMEESARLADIQNRAFTLVLWTYDRVRRAVELARWDERDAASITPNLYQHRSRKRTSARAVDSGMAKD